MKRKKMSLDCFGAMKLSHLLGIPGGGIGLLCFALYEWSGMGEFLIAAAVGLLLALAGAAVGWLGIVCPRCAAPLYEFPRLPRNIPQYCPRCGEKITPEKDD